MPDKIHPAAVRAALACVSGPYTEATAKRITREYAPLVEAVRKHLEEKPVAEYSKAEWEMHLKVKEVAGE